MLYRVTLQRSFWTSGRLDGNGRNSPLRIGYCTNLIATQADGTGSEWIEQGKESGFDYVELPLAQMVDLNEEEFFSLRERVGSSGLRCEACNNFFPGNLRLTGDGVNRENIEKYLDKALGRAVQLGVEVIVFGSPNSRNVPEGYPMQKAWTQLVELLRLMDPMVREEGITVVIEPLCKLESNIINTAAEGLHLVKTVDRDNIKLLIDYYHLIMEREDPSIVLQTASYLKHVHFANPSGRAYPVEIMDDYIRLTEHLKQIGYDSRISVEANTMDFCDDARRSAGMLRQLVTGGSS